MEILSKNTNRFKNKIYNAGSIGIGVFSPVAASDYTVGTNHTLGTLGSSKFASGLSLNDFYKGNLNDSCILFHLHLLFDAYWRGRIS